MTRWRKPGSLLLLLACGGAATAQTSLEDRVRQLEDNYRKMETHQEESGRRQEILTGEVRRVREEVTLPAKPELKSQYGMGPAASKVYDVPRGLSVGGYGQGWYTALVEDRITGDHNSVDLVRLVLYTGYKFSDDIVFNSEVEYEHGTTSNPGNGAGEVSVEFAQVDFLFTDAFNLRLGLLLLPVGFVNEIHEPVFYHGNERPEVERQIIPSTWRENGFGAFGRLGDEVTYRAYLVTSTNGSRISAGGLRGARQQGSRAFADDFSAVVRADWQPNPDLMVGGSVYTGDQGQDSLLLDPTGTLIAPDISTTLVEGHVQYRHEGLELRALGSTVRVGDAAALSGIASLGARPVAEEMVGWYGEVAYDLADWIGLEDDYLAPFFRYEAFDTQHRVPAGLLPDLTRDVILRTSGLTWKPDPQLAIKLDHRDFSRAAGTRADEINLGLGWIF